MAELQRSVTSFRRQGSSGLVWGNRFLTGHRDQNHNQQENERVEDTEQKQSRSVGSTAMLDRSRSAGTRPYRTVNVAPPSKDPPSPKVKTCGLCGFFGKPVAGTHKSNPKSKNT